MSESADSKREVILEAALKAFALYGYKRTSMEAIASGTGLSRASLYQHFSNKEEIFRALSEGVHGQALDAVAAALGSDAPLASRLEDALVAKVGRLLAIVADSPHGEEIVDESSRLCGDIVLDSSQRFQRILAAELAAASRAGDVSFAGSGMTASAAAELLRLSATGLKYEVANERQYRKRIRNLVRVFLAGVGAVDR